MVQGQVQGRQSVVQEASGAAAGGEGEAGEVELSLWAMGPSRSFGWPLEGREEAGKGVMHMENMRE